MSARPAEPGPWQLTRATVRGKAHVDSGLPNQDWVEVRSSADARVVAAVLSDGAGTAQHAHVGSRTTCELMVAYMLDIGHDMLRGRLDTGMVSDKLAAGIGTVRRKIDPTGKSLRHYHCTFVACVLTDKGGFVCQVGDSIVISTRFSEGGELPPQVIDFFPDHLTRVFGVERGEYANETHFITEDDWRSHLRVSRVADADVDALLLMTDGAMDVAMVRGKVFRGFLSNLIGKLIATPAAAERDKLLEEWLADPRTYRATADDKTMFVAIRGSHWKLAGRAIHQADEATGMSAPKPPPGKNEPASRRAAAGTKHAGDAATADANPGSWYARRLSRTAVAAMLTLGTAAILAGILALWYPHLVERAVAWTVALFGDPSSPAPRPGSAVPKGGLATPAASAHGAVSPKPKATLTPAAPARAAAQLDAIAPPTAAPHAPAELVFMPHPSIELVLRPGASTDVTVRLVAGGEVRLVSVDSPKALQVKASPPCSADGKLTAATSTCVIRIEAAKKAPTGKHKVSIVFSDLQADNEQTLSLAVRLVPAASR